MAQDTIQIRGGGLGGLRGVSRSFRPPNVPLRGELLITIGETRASNARASLKLRAANLEEMFQDAAAQLLYQMGRTWEQEGLKRWPVRTGRSRSTLRFRQSGRVGGRTPATYLVAASDADYARALEVGSYNPETGRRRRPGRYLRRGWNASRRQWRGRSARYILQRLDRYIRRERRRRLVRVDRRV